VLGLIAQHAPADARSGFLAVLRARGLREPYDRAAGPDLVPAWRLPAAYVAAFVAEVLPALDAPEWTAAAQAIDSLSQAPARRSRASAAAGAGQTGDGQHDGTYGGVP
jgi:hypothetical protein